MAPPADALEGLRDIHWPAIAATSPVSDLATAALVGFALAACAFAAWTLLRRGRRPARRAAHAALAGSRRLAAEERLSAQAALLRRAASAVAGAPAKERGEAWLARLDDLFATTFFTQGDGAVFGDALYTPAPAAPVEAIDRTLQTLLAGLKR
jgi:hypothetical protein